MQALAIEERSPALGAGRTEGVGGGFFGGREVGGERSRVEGSFVSRLLGKLFPTGGRGVCLWP